AMFERDKESAVRLAEEKTKNQLAADLAKRDTEIAELRTRTAAELKELESERQLATARIAAEKDAELAKLRAELQSVETKSQLALTETVSKIERERDQLVSELKSKDAEKQLLETTLRDKYETQIKDREDTIERLKDMKAKLSVKLLGENL